MSKTHNYTNAHRYWGHDIHWRLLDSKGQRLDAGGWGGGIKQGDFLLVTNPGNGYETRYQVESIKYYADPADQWSAVLTYSPRTPEVQP